MPNTHTSDERWLRKHYAKRNKGRKHLRRQRRQRNKPPTQVRRRVRLPPADKIPPLLTKSSDPEIYIPDIPRKMHRLNRRGLTKKLWRQRQLEYVGKTTNTINHVNLAKLTRDGLTSMRELMASQTGALRRLCSQSPPVSDIVVNRMRVRHSANAERHRVKIEEKLTQAGISILRGGGKIDSKKLRTILGGSKPLRPGNIPEQPIICCRSTAS